MQGSDKAALKQQVLTQAEAAFRTLKSPLGERPIFHHKEMRVEAHIFLCVLSYHLLMSIEKTEVPPVETIAPPPLNESTFSAGITDPSISCEKL